MKKTKVVIIGTGMIAKEHLKCLKKLPNVDVAGVCDLSPSKAESTSQRFEVPKWSTNFEELICITKPNIAHVTSSPSSHFRITKHLLESGVSAFVEKPITSLYSEFQILKSLAKKNGLILLENHNYQFNSPIQDTLKLIQDGKFGKVQHIEITLCLDSTKSKLFSSDTSHPALHLPGGVIMEFLTHLANLSYIFAGHHTKVQTSWRKSHPHSPFPYDEFRALIETKKSTASITFSSNVQREGFWVSVYGSKMRATINLFESRLILEAESNLPRPLMYFSNGIKESATIFGNSFQSLWNKLKGNPGGYSGLTSLLKRTYNAIEKNEPLPITIEQIDEVNRLIADMTKDLTPPPNGGFS